MSMSKSNNKRIYVLLSLIMLLGIIRLSYGFFFQKNTFHSDEAWSFGLANSYYEPYIQYNDDTTEYKNINTWISGDVFTDYLTVQKGERFSIGSVYYNQTCDLHPPLYYIILNFLCSLFPDHFILAIGFFINLIAFIVMTLYIFKLTSLMTGSKSAGLLCVLFSTFSLAMLCMTMFVRMYMLVATIAIVFAYYTAKLYYSSESRKSIKSYITLGLLALIGALTDNFFLAYAFGLSFVMFLYWLCKKEFKTLLKYSATLLSSILISILIFSKGVMSALGLYTTDVTPVTKPNPRIMPVYYQFKQALSHVNKELWGFAIPVPQTNWWLLYSMVILFVVLTFLLLIRYLLRNEEWFKSFNEKLREKEKFIVHEFTHNINFMTIALVIGILITCLAAAYLTNLDGAKEYGDRYIMVCLPAAMVVFVLFWRKLFTVILNNKKRLATALLFVVLLVATIFSNMRECHYFFKYPNTMQLEDIAEDSNFIVVSTNKWLLVQYAAKLFGCNDVFYTTYYELDAFKDEIEGHNLTGPTYIVIDTTIFDYYDEETESLLDETITNSDENTSVIDATYTFKNTYSRCNNLSFVNNMNYIGEDYMNGFHLKVYKVKD